MEVLKFAQSKRLLASVAILSLLAGSLSLAQNRSSSEYVIETLHVFPDVVEGSGWNNLDTVVSQNLDGESLFQDFSIFNSASLDRNFRPAIKNNTTPSVINNSVDDNEENEVFDLGEAPSDVSDESSNEVEPSSQDLQTGVEEVSESEQVDSPAPEAQSADEGEVVSFGFPWAVESATYMQASNETLVDETEESQADDEVQVVEEAEQESNILDDVTETQTQISETQADESQENLDEVQNPKSEVTTETETQSEPKSEIEESVQHVVPENTMQLSGFDMPLFNDDNLGLDGGQFRVSMAAQKKPGYEDEYAAIAVEYSYDNGSSWSSGGEVEIVDEIANSINGGYYLFALPELTNPDQLEKLHVRLSFVGDRDSVRDVFVESAWLELFTYSEREDEGIEDFLGIFDDNYNADLLSGDELSLPDGSTVDFEFTDDNTHESLVIKSDSVSYEGLTKATMYFNVTNESNREDTFNVRTYFPQGVGNVTSLSEWNQNKEKKVTIPEMRPVVYHCDAGWEQTDAPAFDNVLEFSRQFGSSTITEQAIEPYIENINNIESEKNFFDEVIDETVEEAVVPIDSEVQVDEAVQIEEISEETSVEVPVTADEPLMQAVALENISSSTEESSNIDTEDEVVSTQYLCRETSIVRSCDSVDGEGTQCHRDSVKIKDHVKTIYTGGWDDKDLASTTEREGTGTLSKVAAFFGLAAKVKDVPSDFEPRTTTPDDFTIAAGETKYFKLELAFPALSSGEFWIETVGNREYGLLDPFWSSNWTYKLPISIDNTAGEEKTEQQVFLELTSAGLTDFWSNVNSDGSDVRFLREIEGNEADWADATYAKRQLLPVTTGATAPSGGYNGYTVRAVINTAALVATSSMLSTCDDLRIFYDNGSGFTELDRVIHGCNTSTTSVMFALQANHANNTTVTDYYMYYDKPAAGIPPADPTAVYLWYDDVSSDRLSEYTRDQGDNWSTNSWANSFAYNAAGYYTFDTGNNSNDSMRIPSATLSERDAYIEAEWYITACYPNYILFGNMGRYTSNASYYSTLRAESLLPNCNAGGYANDGDIVRSAVNAVALNATNPGDIADNQWRKVALSSYGINQAVLTHWDIDNATTEPVLGFINAAAHASGTDSGTDVENSGEWGVMTAEAGGRIRNLLVRRYTSPEPAVVGSTTDSYTPTSFVELDYWIQHFDDTAEEADIWLQVDTLPAAASSTIYMYYGNASAVSASNETTPFTYSTSTPIYYVVDGHSGLSQISVVSLIDDNEVSLNGGVPVSLDLGQRTTFTTFTATSTLSVLGPISAAITSSSGDGSETIVPISFATTTHVIGTNRYTERWYVLSPFASTSVSSYIANSGTPNQTQGLATGTAATFTADPGTGQGVVIEAANPVLMMQVATTPRDGVVSYPPTQRDIFGFDSTRAYASGLASSPDPTVYCSGGSSAVVSSITRGGQTEITTCSGGNQNAGDSLRLTGQSSPITAIQQADADGGESTTFWPQHEFSTVFAVSNDAQYVAMVCSPRFGAATIEVRNATGTAVASGTCTPGVNAPGALHLGDSGTNSNLSFVAGNTVVSTNGVPFYLVFEDITVDSDEKNVLGSVQARKFGADEFSYSFGAQVINNDTRWVQNSFHWYENINANTPTSSWPLGIDSSVVEGGAITEAGAVSSGQVLRLRMNMEATVATATPASTAFALQYAATSTCSLASESDWYNVAPIGSTTAAFSGYNNASVIDGASLTTLKLASSTDLGTYEEQNDSEQLPVQVDLDDFIEFDWVITAAAVEYNTEYCFRTIRSNGQSLYSYTTYPELITSGPPLAPSHLLPFDNEHEPDQTPQLEFVATDISGDDVDFQVQIDNDIDFSSTVVDRTSEANPLDFYNATTPSDKRPFNSGDHMQFTTPTLLSTSTTYWWRVRAKDPTGSNTYGDWSTPTSFTVEPTVSVSTWFQTTGHQFSTNTRTNTATTSGTITVTGGVGSITSTAINFDDADIGNAWGDFSWSHTVTSGSALYSVEYQNGTSWSLIPESDLPGNAAGFSSGPVNLTSLNTDTYNVIRVVANYNGTVTLNDWTVTWGLRVDIPTLTAPFDHELESDTTPALTFFTTDPQSDDLLYEVSYSTSYSFTSSTTITSDASPDFANQTTPADTTPFNSGDTITYTIPSPLSASTTYWWKVRAKDPAGGDSFSPWSEPMAFTIGSTTVSTWYQTTRDQFERNTLTGLSATASGAVKISSDIGEFGTVTVTNGTWTTVDLTNTYNDPVVVTSVRYNRSTENQRTSRVRNKDANSFELLATNYNSSITGSTLVDYMVIEAGDWTIADGGSGKRIVAGTYEDVSDVQANTYASSGFGADVTFSPAFSTAPAVIATVSTDNDSSWVYAHTNDGNTRNNPPTTSALGLYLGRGFENAVHSPEDIDYVAMATGHGTNNGSEFDAVLGPDNVSSTPYTVSFSSVFGSAPQVTLVQQGAEQGGNGAYALTHTGTPTTVSGTTVAMDEDGTSADRTHTTEPTSHIAFQNSSGIIQRIAGVGSLTGTMYSEAITFSDGSGPKFGSFTWNDTKPGTSSITYQVEQYSTSTGWMLVPDSTIPENSLGTSTKPIDLTGIDIATYPQIRLVANFACGGVNCPTMEDWQVTWADGVSMSGTLKEYDRLTNVNSGSIGAYVNGSLLGSTGSVSAGVWTLNNVTAFAGDIVTVFVDGAGEAQEAIAVLNYDGVGDITGVELFEQHLSISSNEEAAVTNANLAASDYSATLDEDISFEVDGSYNLLLCGQGTCSDMNLYVGPSNTYQPQATGAVVTYAHDLVNDGTITANANTLSLGGSYVNRSVYTPNTSVVIMTATSSSEVISDVSGTINLHSLTINSVTGTGTSTISSNLSLTGNLSVLGGVFVRTAHDISLAGSVTSGATGKWVGYGTTTFNGSVTSSWSDASSPSQNIGNVIIDGSLKTVNITSNVRATNVTIGSNDTLGGGTGNTIEVAGNWTNNNTFTAGTSNVQLIDDPNGYRLASTTQSDWLSESWNKRVAITVQASQITGPLSNFPVYVDLATMPSSFWSTASSSGSDIRVTSADGISEVPVEAATISSSTQSGEVYFRAGSLTNATNTTFYLYYGNSDAVLPAANSAYGSQNVWSNNYEVVYHLTEGALSGTSTEAYNDSTSNIYHGDDRTVAASNDGIVGNGVEMLASNAVAGTPGNADHIKIPYQAIDTQTDLTFTTWYKTSSSTIQHTLFSGARSAQTNELIVWLPSNTQFQHYEANSASVAITIPTVATGNWKQYVTTRNDTANTMEFYVDGIYRGQDTNQQMIAVDVASGYFNMGFEQDALGGGVATNQVLDGSVDEVRIASVIRNSDWVAAEYNTAYSPASFYNVGSEETRSSLSNEVPSHLVTANSQFYKFTMNDATTSASFVNSSFTTTNDFIIATGTITLPTVELKVGGSFLNNGGIFLHNNGKVVFNGTGARSVQLLGTAFLNTLYDVTFSSAGSWTMLDTNATTSHEWKITAGSVTLPSGSLYVGGDFAVAGSGSFSHNNGTVVMSSDGVAYTQGNGSSFSNVIITGTSNNAWYRTAWQNRIPMTISSSSISANLTDFPVYVDLSKLGSNFFSNVNTTGSDIRITDSSGVTELPYDLVAFNKTAKTGELHFLASSISSSTDTTFYVYHNNVSAATYSATSTYGRNAVWDNYEAVYHFSGNPAVSVVDATSNGFDLSPSGTGQATTSGKVGSSALDLTLTATGFLTDSDWTWSSSDDLISSGWYYQDAASAEAVWAFGTGAPYMDFLPWYSGSASYHRFGNTSGANYTFAGSVSAWNHFTTIGRTGNGNLNEIYENATLRDTVVNNTNPTNGPLQVGRYTTAGSYQGFIDELRFTTAVPSVGWIAAEYSNQQTPGTFLATSSSQTVQGRIFSEAIVTAVNNFTIDAGSVILPSGQLYIGGSFDNNSYFSPNNGTVVFNSTAGSETIAAGASSFVNLTLNSATGIFSIVENATTTGEFKLQSVSSFTLNPGVTVEVAGTMLHEAVGANTTWTGSNIVFSGSDHTVNSKTHSGDTFDNVFAAGDTDISWWNSSATVYNATQTSSFYSMDNAGVDGALNIYGDYRRSSGTEYWNYSNDFDGAVLSGVQQRAVLVQIASSSVVRVSTAQQLVGAATATTTVGAISGTYTLLSNGADITANYFEISGTNADGWQLTNSTGILSLGSGSFDIASGTTAITVDASTINANPAGQYSGVIFDTVATVATNVTTTGEPASYWWFKNGSGNRYGEAFDADSGDPGTIRWDDSQLTLVISGTVYDDDGLTPASASLCDGIASVVKITVNSVVSTTTPCSPLDGTYSAAISYTGDPEIMAFLDASQYGASPTDVVLDGSLTATGTIANSQVIIDRPTVTDGDLLVLILGKDDDPGVTALNGWTLVSELGLTSNDQDYTALWIREVVDAESESSQYSFYTTENGEGYSYWIGSFSGVDLKNPFENTPIWTQLVNDIAPATVGTTTIETGSYALSAWYVDNDSAITPTGVPWTDLASNIVSPTDPNNLSIAGRPMPSVGSTGNPTITGVTAGRDPHVLQAVLRRATFSQTAPTATVTKTPVTSSWEYNPNPITLVATSSGSSVVVAAGTFSLTRPVVKNGDVLIAFVGKDDGNFNITPPAGWTLINDLANGTIIYTGAWYHIVTDASAEPLTYDFTSNDTSGEGHSYWLGAYRGVDVTNPFDVTSTWSSYTNDPAPVAPSITTVTNDSYLLAVWYVDADNNVTLPGSPWTTQIQNLYSEGGLNILSQYRPTAGNTGDETATDVTATSETNSMQIALRPIGYGVPDRISNFDLYAGRVITRSENGAAFAISDMDQYDSTDDADVPFTVALGSPDTLTVSPGAGLFVWPSSTLTPDGNITLSGGALADRRDGSLTLGSSANFTAAASESHALGGSLYVGSSATFIPSTSNFNFTATTSGNEIGASGSTTVNLNTFSLTGSGELGINTPVITLGTTTISSGTLTGISNLTISNGSLTGNGSVDMSAGTVRINKGNTFGGSSPWYFNNLTFGDGASSAITTPVTSATTTVRGVLTVSTAHFLDALSTSWNLSGSGSVFVETGSFLEGTSIVQYSGATPNILNTSYYNLLIDSSTSTVVATAPTTGLQILNNLTIGAVSTSTLNLNTNDPTTGVSGLAYIGPKGTLLGSNSAQLQIAGSWDNDGVYTHNNGTISFIKSSGLATIAAGNSPFYNLSITGAGSFTMTESATSTATTSIGVVSTFVLDSGQTLAVGGPFQNNTNGGNTTWTGSTLSLFGNNSYLISSRSVGDDYAAIVVASGTQPRIWNSTFSSITADTNGSLYSMNHNNVLGDLYIYGKYRNSSYNDYWSYAEDFDGTSLGGSPRAASVYIAAGGAADYTGGSLYVVGTGTASTTITNQGSGNYSLSVGGNATTSWEFASLRDIDAAGLTFTGSPTVVDFNNNDLLVEQNSATAMSVNGTVINKNPARNFNLVSFASSTGVTGAQNVLYTGTTVSSWRFVNAYGSIAGESFDSDSGDPGEIVWDDSAALITVSGRVYSDEGSTVSTVCDGSTNVVTLRIAGLVTASTSCAVGTGLYTIPNVSFSSADTLTAYIDGQSQKGAAVTVDPVSNIFDMDIYERRVIVRNETSDPIRISDLAVWDSSDDPDIQFTAVDGGSDTLSLAADNKLIIWANKTFEPAGNVTVSGGGSGDAVDGTLEAFAGATFKAAGTEAHEVNGSLVFGAGATFTAASSTITLSSTAAGRTVDVNSASFYNIEFTGSGVWSVVDPTLTINNNLLKTGGSLTLPSATTTIGGNFDNTGGTFGANGGTLVFTATDAGNTVSFGGSSANIFRKTGVGSITISDANATTTGSFIISAGTLTMPSGSLTVGGDFFNAISSTLTHNSGSLIMSSSTGTSTISQNGDDLNHLTIIGAGNFVMTDGTATLRGNLNVLSGALTTATNTLSLAGSLDASTGVLNTGSSTVLFNATAVGKSINPGSNTFYNMVFASASGGWTLNNATTTNNFSLVAGSSFTQSSGTRLVVGGVFTNTVGGVATTWTGSTLELRSGTLYTANTKAAGGDAYATLELVGNTDVRFWNSSYSTTTLAASSSVYSQDHGVVDGALRIFGDFTIGTTTEYWNYANDFDGTVLTGGQRRAVAVTFDDSTTAGLHMTSGNLNMIGVSTATTTVIALGSHNHSFSISGGTFDADYYSFNRLNSTGLSLTNSVMVSGLDNGSFTQALNTANLISLDTVTLNANASLLASNVYFNDGGFTGGVNVNLTATSTSAWQFKDHSGNLAGELYDVDGTDDCGSIRWDDSSCLLLEQVGYRWRNDDGGLGAPTSEWFDTDWAARQRVRLYNSVNTTYSNVAVEVTVPYDASMKSDFEDLRFTDGTGTTEIPYWIETFNAGVSAKVWVKVPSLPARDTAHLFMYYSNVSASTTGSSTLVFTAADDFETGSITSYSGDTIYEASAGFAYGGSYGVAPKAANKGSRATNGIARFDRPMAQGQIIRYRQYVDVSAGSDDESCVLFGVQSPITNHSNYGVCLELFGTDRLVLARNVESTDSFGSVVVMSSTTVTYTTGWYDVEVDWQTSGLMSVSLYNPSGTLVATTSATNSTYTSGGFGFTSWGQNGGWDSIVSYPRVAQKPTVYFGQEQTFGGATWNQLQDIAGSNYAIGSVARLRFILENSGLDLTGQQFLLEYAPKGVAPTCDAISGGSYSAVPNIASCGTDDLCMATSSNIINGESVTDLLVGANGDYTSGYAIEDPSNKTTSFNLDEDNYVEVEYAITPTINVADEAYCLRVTNNGTELDAYAKIAELTLEFAPSLGAIQFNQGNPIILSIATSTNIYATTSVTDLNGYTDLTNATTTFYKSNVAGLADCTPDDNNCYRTTIGSGCSFTACSGNSCTLQCIAPFAYHTDPTDLDGGVFWYAYTEVEDSTNNVDIGTSPANDVTTLRALSVNNSIAYGAVGVNEDTNSFNPSVDLQNLGNDALDVLVQGTDLSDGATSNIDVNNQKYATSTFTYSSCTQCSTLSEIGSALEVDLDKPIVSTPYVTDQLFWGIYVPFGTNSAAHTGINTFIATGD